jgi:NADPH-dependent 2,4-dienoyl-CoA reductase/sulfur reductase-like enzyme
MSERELDLLVVGGGIAGLAATVRSLELGRRVTLVEKADPVGGNGAHGLYVWSAPSAEVLAAEIPRGDPELQRTLVESVPLAVEWVRSLGVHIDEPVQMMRFGEAGRS